MFTGSMVAIVTPFRNGAVDREALRRLIEFQLENGTDAIVPCGTTGESATLSHEEHDMVVEFVVEVVDGRVPVIAGAGSNNTAEAVRLTRHAKDAGADGALLITPYYNRPTQEGLFRHYETVAQAVDIPMVVYNVPSRTGTDLLPDTVARLAEIPQIVGLKEATACMGRATEIVARTPEEFSLISGDDGTFFPLLCVGGRGVISVAANVAPGLMAGLYDAFAGGDFAAAAALHHRIQDLCRAMFVETNPVPVKEALALMGRIVPEVRLPLCSLRDESRDRLRGVLERYGLLS